MAPGTRRANRSGYVEQDDFEGLPVRQWRHERTTVAPPPPQEPAQKNDIWAHELFRGMPRDAGLLPQHSQDLLRAARSGRLYKRPAPAEDDEADADLMLDNNKPDKKDDDDSAARGFHVKVWKQVNRNAENATASHLAKRRKGVVTISSKTLSAPPPSVPTVTRATVRRTDAAGNSYTQEITLQEGQKVDGEIIATAVVPLSAPSEQQPQPTPPRNRRPPPPKKNKKLGGPGRGRKKKNLPAPAPAPGQEGAVEPPPAAAAAAVPADGVPAQVKQEGAEVAAGVAAGGADGAATGENERTSLGANYFPSVFLFDHIADYSSLQSVKQEPQEPNNPDSVMAENDDEEGDDGDDGNEVEGEGDNAGGNSQDQGQAQDEDQDHDQVMTDAASSIVQPSAESTTEINDVDSLMSDSQQGTVNPLLAPPLDPSLSASPKPEGSPLKNVVLPSPTETSSQAALGATGGDQPSEGALDATGNTALSPAGEASKPKEESSEAPAEVSLEAATETCVETGPEASAETQPMGSATDTLTAPAPAETSAADNTVTDSKTPPPTQDVQAEAVEAESTTTILPPPDRVGNITSPEHAPDVPMGDEMELTVEETVEETVVQPTEPREEAPPASAPPEEEKQPMEPAVEDVTDKPEGETAAPQVPPTTVEEAAPAEASPKAEVQDSTAAPPPDGAAVSESEATLVSALEPESVPEPVAASNEEGPDLLAGLETALDRQDERVEEPSAAEPAPPAEPETAPADVAKEAEAKEEKQENTEEPVEEAAETEVGKQQQPDAA